MSKTNNIMNSTNLPVPHKNNFDLLRLVFASMVVFFHIGILSQSPVLSWTMNISATFAVQAFFVVSGYLVTMSCEKSRSLLEYGKKRLFRIAPAYVFVVVGAAIILSTMSSLSAVDYFSNVGFWRYIGMNLALANFSAPSLPGVFVHQYESAVNVSLWTIKIEVLFYACAPVIVWASRRIGYRPVLGMLFVLSSAWMSGFSFFGEHAGNDFYLRLAKQLPGQLAYFVGGAWCYYATRDGARLPTYAAVLALVFYASTNGWLFRLGAPLAVAAIVSWAALTLPRLGDVGKHGDFSFGIYLFHVPIVQTAIALGYFSSNPVATMLGTIMVVFSAAVFSWNFIEKPFLKHRTSAITKQQVINCTP
ncbi:acyltransferase [Duganella sp. Leaf126]|uniref:acyltransferase family protein n=1 Tax=Duganella sp. Leaf126 TaxID=1736266 RepID=UPI001E4350A5|nr:acyltransferase [Duganella sp. Leaf126]